MSRSLSAAALALWLGALVPAQSPVEVLLWPDGAPGALGAPEAPPRELRVFAACAWHCRSFSSSWIKYSFAPNRAE